MHKFGKIFSGAVLCSAVQNLFGYIEQLLINSFNSTAACCQHPNAKKLAPNGS
jgi:hypothetical protein